MKKKTYVVMVGLVALACVGGFVLNAQAKPAKKTRWGACLLCNCTGGSSCYWIEDQQIYACKTAGCKHDVDHHKKK